MISAIVMIKADVQRIPEVGQAIANLSGVAEVYSVTGDVDLIAVVKVAGHDEIAEVVSDKLNKVPGVLDSETHIAFRTYASQDLDAAFALGLDEDA
ncbi:Lrp/AsnC ligand binding domain-containing protein [Branchiibius sp. NY16-3462-2]|uniref:Lrp/AsnC family transcriptional regulator n=1 Tax=Branchiibius sp. NY16-3462-2 TaxID=1807500 RepID=UPI00079BECAF|nr:Lrp/AsnC ligand binding domain-containing protein [Branchiibius sp. NY16-3462-2]KYH44034.1 AsnC family transcriptional regulator [Branchiibius sp. NY16-3462-2]